jgi:hypothetical protein
MNMHWSRIHVSRSNVTLLNSDRPIDKPLGLSDRLAYIAFPIDVLPRCALKFFKTSVSQAPTAWAFGPK